MPPAWARLLLLGCVSCGGAAAPTRTGSPATVAARCPDAAELARLDAAGERGDAAAAATQVQSLVVCFDAARFGRDDAARRALLDSLKVVEADRSRAAITDEALDRMLVAADRLLHLDRLSPAGQTARTLLEHDRRPPASRAELLSRVGALKTIAAAGGPLAPSARLRLAGVCLQAFRDAVAAPLHRRGSILTHCLYPLWDSDPEPYFDDDPRRRPPPPAWTDLDARLRKLLGEVGEPLAAAARRALDDHVARVRKAEEARLFLPRLDPRELGLPTAPDAPLAYDGEPIVLGAGEVSAGALEPQVRADDRRRVALALPGSAPAAALVAAADKARQAGARAVGIAVGVPQALKAPAGDYWAGRAETARVGLFPLAVAGGEEARAALSLHLVLAATRWEIAAPSGTLPVAADPARLKDALVTVRRAFPDEDGLYLVPSLPVESVVGAMAAARQAGFRWFALASGPPASRGNDLAERVRRRAAAEVKIVPDALADRVPALRGCYLAALDRNPRLFGVLELEVSQGKARTTGPGDAELKRCVEDRVLPRMRDTGIPSARIDLSN